MRPRRDIRNSPCRRCSRASASRATPSKALPQPRGRERLMSEVLRPAAATDLWRQPRRRSGFRRRTRTPRSTQSVSSKPPMPRRNRSPSRWRCAKRCMTARPRRWSRPTARSGVACLRRSRAGTSRRKIPAATRLPTRRPEFSPGSRPKPRSAGLRRSRCSRCSSIRCCGLAVGNRERAVAALERAVLRGPRPRPGSAGLAHALQSFRAQLDKLRRGEAVDLHRSDPRIGLADSELVGRRRPRSPARRRAWRRWKASAGRSARSSDIAARHRDVLAALSRRRRSRTRLRRPRRTQARGRAR